MQNWWGAVGGVVLGMLVVLIASLGGDSGVEMLVLAPAARRNGSATAAD